MFEASDIIALGGLAVAAITVIFGYLQNRANNRAKLTELAFEKRLEAFREVYAAIHKLNVVLTSSISVRRMKRTSINIKEHAAALYEKYDMEGIDIPNMPDEALEEMTSKLEDNLSGDYQYFMTTYIKNRVYIPAHIDMMITHYAHEVRENLTSLYYAGTRDFDLAAFEDNIETMAKTILTEMHKFIGYE